MLSPSFGEMCSNIERCVFRASLDGAHFLLRNVYMKNDYFPFRTLVNLMTFLLGIVFFPFVLIGLLLGVFKK